jgi:hypothetical protein
MIPFSNKRNLFICNRKEWVVDRSKGEREREIERCGEWAEWVGTWVINLTVRQVFMNVYCWDNPEVYQSEQ